MASISQFPRPHLPSHVFTSAEEIVEAQQILADHFAPNGIPDREGISRLLEILDCPEGIEIFENNMACRDGGHKLTNELGAVANDISRATLS